jgi:spermidine synthase
VVLKVGGREQSTLVPARPTELVYEYLRRVEAILDEVPAMRRPRGEGRTRVLHLGGGALTLPRRLEVSHPGTSQVVVDLDRELLDMVLASYPLGSPELTRPVVGDVQLALDQVVGDAPFAAVVLDIALDCDSPARLSSPEYMTRLASLAEDTGAVIINVGDEDGDPTRAVIRGCLAAGASVFVTGPSDVVDGSYTGNLIVAASRTPWDGTVLDKVRAAGPQPAAVLSGTELELYVAD